MTSYLQVPAPARSRTSKISIHKISTTPPGTPMEQQSSDEEECCLMDMDEMSPDETEDDSTVQLLFSKIYVDPLQEVFEGLDSVAAEILRTGKFTVTGETGNMDFLQPLLFSLQATEPELTLLLPQLMQNPFFNQKDQSGGLGFTSSITADNLLCSGHIRLGVRVDNLIYQLLSSHCCKGLGSRQADALMETAFKTTYNLPNSMMKFIRACENPPPLVTMDYTQETPLPALELSDGSDEEKEDFFNRRISSSSGISTISPRDKSSSFIGESNADLPFPGTLTRNDELKNPLKRYSSTARRDSYAGMSQLRGSGKSRDSRDSRSSISSSSSLKLLHEPNTWHVDLLHPEDTVIGSYGDNSYPILMWNPDLKVHFQIGSKLGTMSSTTAYVSSDKTSLSLQILNTSDVTITFSIRSYRQSLLFRSHIIYPSKGLHILHPGEELWKDVDVIRSKVEREEHLIIDLMVCSLGEERSWNIQRRYAVLKYFDSTPDQHRLLRKLSRAKETQPGPLNWNRRDLTSTMKQVMLHGLQSVVKNKLDEAEIIFTQALHLPMFQRLPLKAFAYVCLAVVANKRRKRVKQSRVSHVLKLVISLDKLIETCDSAATSQMRMPKMIALVKQLKKELNPPKIIEDTKDIAKKPIREEMTKSITEHGQAIDLHDTSLLIPGGAVPQPTQVALSSMNADEIHQSIQSSSWASMLTIHACINIQCSPPVERFSKPVIATVLLPEGAPLPSPPFRLLQSNYMSNWIDITDQPTTEVTSSRGRLTIRTDYTGWLAVASVNIDMSQIMQMGVKSVFSEEPIVLQVNVFSRTFPDNVQISAFISPVSKDESGTNHKMDPPKGHKRISFPHSFKAYKGHRIQLELQGKMIPDGNESLVSEYRVDGSLEIIMEKSVFLTDESNRLNGRLVISTFCHSHNNWELVQEINLSSSSSISSSIPSLSSARMDQINSLSGIEKGKSCVKIENKTQVEEQLGDVNNEDHSCDKIKILQKELQSLQEKYSQRNEEVDKLKNKLILEKEKIKELELELENLKISPDIYPNDREIQLMTDYLDDVHVVGERHFLINGETTHSFNWEECGLRIHAEQGTVPSSSTCQVDIKALVGGEFIFPSNTELVSAVYAISVSETLLKPIKLSVQHCVVLKHKQQAEYLSFAKSPLTPPHKFETIEGGQFPTDDRYGFITCDSFSLLTILKRIKRWVLRQESPSMNEECTEHVGSQDNREGSDITGLEATITIDQSITSIKTFEECSLHVDHVSNTESLVHHQTQTDVPDTSPTSTVSLSHDKNEGISTPQYSGSSHQTQQRKDNLANVPDNQYFGQVYYVPETTPNSWLLKLLVGKDLETLKKYMTSEHTHAEKDICVLFCFHSDGSIELNLTKEQERPNKGWEVFPLHKPCKLSKKDADEFGSKKIPFPPQCWVKVCGENGPGTAAVLRYYVPLIGVECQCKEICISRNLNTATASPQYIQESAAIPQRGGDMNIDGLRRCINTVFDCNIADLHQLFKHSLTAIANEMLQAGLVSRDVHNEPTVDNIIKEFIAGMLFISEQEKIEEHCIKFLSVLYKMQGPFIFAADKIKNDLIKEVNKKLPGVQFKLDK